MGTVARQSVDRELAIGDVVEVRSAEEILAGLDERGELDALPFMPEMLQFAGRRFVVDKIAFKTCDTATWTGMRRMTDTVHLKGLRCDGQAHGGCQAGCLLFWRTSWLTRVPDGSAPDPAPPAPDAVWSAAADAMPTGAPGTVRGCTPERLVEIAHGACRPEEPEGSDSTDGQDGIRYSCQATELPRAAPTVISMWQPGQYVEDVRTGNATVGHVIRGILIGFFNQYQDLSRKVLPRLLRIKDGTRYPFIQGSAGKTPVETLGLQPGEWVRVKSAAEIAKTLGPNNRNRGLFFDREMLRYCGRTAQVLRRVDHIVDEASGHMLTMKTPSVILADVVCTADFHRSCSRAIYAYWREIWLERVPAPAVASSDPAVDALPVRAAP